MIGQIQTQIQAQEKMLKDIMHTAIDHYIEHIAHYIEFIHDKTTPEFKNIPADLKEVLDGFGVDELKRFHISKIIKGEESIIEHYAEQITHHTQPNKMLDEILHTNLFVTEDVYLGRAFSFNEEEQKIMHKIVDEIVNLKNKMLTQGPKGTDVST